MKLKLAIVDDNYERKCKLIIAILEKEQIKYETFRSINSFLQTISTKPDAYEGIFLDMQLPQYDDTPNIVIKDGGEQILKNLESHSIDIPFILNTTVFMFQSKLETPLYKNMYSYIGGLGTRRDIETIYSFIKQLSERI